MRLVSYKKKEVYLASFRSNHFSIEGVCLSNWLYSIQSLTYIIQASVCFSDHSLIFHIRISNQYDPFVLFFFNQDLMVFIRALDGFLPLSIQRFWFPVKPYVTGLETIKLKANHPWQVNKPPRVWLVRNHLFPACTQLSNGELSKKKKNLFTV